MKRTLSSLAVGLLLALPALAVAAPRDAEAVLNRCGKPIKGDETILDNSVTGGHRLLKYERGLLLFNREENTGWTFVSGTHQNVANLNADQMSRWMPCLPLALADSAAPAPLKKVTEVQRVEVSIKNSLKTVIFSVLGALVLLGIIFYLLAARSKEEGGI